jgi:hypothetical protein
VLWVLLFLSLMLALTPFWRLAAAGFEPTLDQLLQLGCSGPATVSRQNE